jgi:replicative DNA helicase
VVIANLQLMEGSSPDNRVQELSRITRGLKGMARELNVPVMVLSLLSRGSNRAPTSARCSATCANRARSSRTPTWC